VNEQRVSRLNEIGTVRLPSLLGDALVAVCVLAAVLAGCTSPSPTSSRDAIASGSSSAEPSAPSAPRFAAAVLTLKTTTRARAIRLATAQPTFESRFLVGSHSHLDQIFEGRVIISLLQTGY